MFVINGQSLLIKHANKLNSSLVDIGFDVCPRSLPPPPPKPGPHQRASVHFNHHSLPWKCRGPPLLLKTCPSLSVYVSVSVCPYLYLCLCVSVSVCPYLYLCLCVSVSVCPYLYLCLCVSVNLSLCVSVCPSVCLLFVSVSVSVLSVLSVSFCDYFRSACVCLAVTLDFPSYSRLCLPWIILVLSWEFVSSCFCLCACFSVCVSVPLSVCLCVSLYLSFSLSLFLSLSST